MGYCHSITKTTTSRTLSVPYRLVDVTTSSKSLHVSPCRIVQNQWVDIQVYCSLWTDSIGSRRRSLQARFLGRSRRPRGPGQAGKGETQLRSVANQDTRRLANGSCQLQRRGAA